MIQLRSLDAETLALFAGKGQEDPTLVVPQAGNANAVKVRRIMQVVQDLAGKPANDLRILDLACGEGVYAIETALGGASVLALDARTERMDKGAAAARRLGLSNLRFAQDDVRRVARTSHGLFDVSYFLGILYHLDAPDVFAVMTNIYEMCEGFVLIDTHICPPPGVVELEWHGRTYRGQKVREHADADTDAAKRPRLLASIDNPFSFYFTKESLIRLLHDTGFSSVFECHAPLEPGKPEDRITLVAFKSERVCISSYPWINGMTEDQIVAALGPAQVLVQSAPSRPVPTSPGTGPLAKRLIKAALRKIGLEVRRV